VRSHRGRQSCEAGLTQSSASCDRRRLRSVFFCTFTLLLLSTCLRVFAQRRGLQSFHHSSWSAEEGLSAVFDIQQAPDGYLWLTTARGVFRFDGVRFESLDEATNSAVSNRDIDSVFVSRSGGVWLTTRTAGMLLWKDGKVSIFPDRTCTPSHKTDGIVEDADGSLWFQNRSGLARLSGTRCEQIGSAQGYPGGFVAAFLIDHRDTLWIATKSGMLLYHLQGQPSLRRASYNGGPTLGFMFMHEAPNGTIWLADESGISPITDDKQVPIASARSKPRTTKSEFGNFTFASDGSLWAGTPKGISRFKNVDGWPANKTLDEDSGDAFTEADGLSSDAIWKIFIDREGSLWVASNGGLDHLRSTSFNTIGVPTGQQTQIGIASGRAGSTWIGSRTLPLTEITSEGRRIVHPEVRLITCIRRDNNGTIWVGGETHLWKVTNGRPELVHYPGETERGVSALATEANGDLWLLLFGGEVYHRKKTGWELQNTALERKPGVLGAMAGDDVSGIWLAYSNNLAHWNGTRYDRYSFPNGTLNISVVTIGIRGDHVWLAGTGGVVLFQNGRFRLMHWRDPELPGRVTGVTETEGGDLWTNGYSGVTHISSSELTRWIREPNYDIQAAHLGALDGLPGLAGDRTPEPSLVESRDGRLWFATTKAVAWLDPVQLAKNSNHVPPPVQITSVAANGRVIRDLADLKLPPRTENLKIAFTALSALVPERVFFRYKLDTVDVAWQDSGTRREAFYTKLPPGRYHFQVLACNNDGVWNNVGATLYLTIAPAYYQTQWFRLVLLGLTLFGIWVIFRMRLQKATEAVQVHLAGQVAERERIARELHDTFLQGLYAILLRFQTIADHLPEDGGVRKMMLDALNRADAVLIQGRDTLRDLRGEPSSVTSLAEELERLAEECRLDSGANFTLVSGGQPRSFHPVIRDEIAQIGKEAILNAIRHSGASAISAKLCYERTFFSLSVIDNGRGVDPLILAAGGKAGHWGMLGMRERCRKIGAQFTISSPSRRGTEVKLRIPSKLAYSSTPGFISWSKNLVSRISSDSVGPDASL
jgi:signal transduction histidine kinase/ligand-binding sensor domain-containing protein